MMPEDAEIFPQMIWWKEIWNAKAIFLREYKEYRNNGTY